ncbi:MAG: hypothetical protein Q9186_006909 [Xanthomendoza sp. 1 TL-2023]
MPYFSIPTASQSTSSSDVNNNGNQSSDLIDSPKALTTFIDKLSNLPKSPPSLYVDLEGVSLSRHGTISILQIFLSTTNHTYLIDIHTLNSKAFHTPSTDGQTTLKSILESPAIPKVFFDVRRDSDALFAHFGIQLAGIHDLQLMELATRNPTTSKKYLNSLAKCIEYDGSMPAQQYQQWHIVKDKGTKLFDPRRGGSYQVFNIRPLSGDLRAYCAQDVAVMPRLWAVYQGKMTMEWAGKVEVATKERVVVSQSEFFQPDGPSMNYGPWTV